jgi:membrane protein DedA with SNARE-associated domain
MLGMFGMPIPDETILAFTGFLLFKNYFHPVPALATAYLGSIFGFTLNYLVGRDIGLPLLQKYWKYLHVSPEKLPQVHRWFEKYGKWSLFGGYFLPGVRHLTAFTAGVAGLEYKRFAPGAYSGCKTLSFRRILRCGLVIGRPPVDWAKVSRHTRLRPPPGPPEGGGDSLGLPGIFAKTRAPW